MKSANSEFYLLLTVTAILLFAHLGLLYVDIMEARNFVTAREMVHDSNWIFTTMNGSPRYEKPPLPTWLSAWMGQFFGFSNIGALRFPASLSCFFTVIYLYKIVDFITNNKKLALISCLVFVTNFLVIYVGRRANWDIYSYSFMVIGIYYFLLALKNIKAYSNYLVAGILFGLSVLSKGPTGPYVLLIPLYLSYVIVYGLPKWKEIIGIAFCAVITILIGFSWYIYIYAADSEMFLSIMEKEATARGNRDVKPFTRYLSFPVQTGIWIFFTVLGLLFPLVKKRTNQPKNYMLFFYWTIFSLIFLSLIPSKKERYLFPMMVPLAVTTGFYINYIITNTSWKNWELKLNNIIFTILGIVAIGIGIGIYFLPIEINFYAIALSVMLLIAGIGILFFIYKKKNFEKAFYGLIFMMTMVGIFGIPVIDKMLNNNKDYKSLTEAKKLMRNDGLKLYIYQEYSPEVWFKYQEVLPEIFPENAQSYPKENEFYIAVNENKPENMDQLKKLGWKVSYIDQYDDNEEGAKSKNNAGRKKHYLYKIQKK